MMHSDISLKDVWGSKPCQKCKGRGRYETTLRDIAGRNPGGYGINATVPCDMPACRRGIVTPSSLEEYYQSILGD